MLSKNLTTKALSIVLHLICFIIGVHARCKNIPTSPSWPSDGEWDLLNHNLAGRLIKAVPSLPPGAVCHPDINISSNSNNATCASTQAEWTTFRLHIDNPIDSTYNNWVNDSCLPDPAAPCTLNGFPSYVVNATGAGDVQMAVNWARERDIRLIVRGTGNDFLGR